MLLESKIYLLCIKSFETKWFAFCINPFFILSFDSVENILIRSFIRMMQSLANDLCQLLLKWTKINITSFTWNILSKSVSVPRSSECSRQIIHMAQISTFDFNNNSPLIELRTQYLNYYKKCMAKLFLNVTRTS